MPAGNTRTLHDQDASSTYSLNQSLHFIQETALGAHWARIIFGRKAAKMQPKISNSAVAPWRDPDLAGAVVVRATGRSEHVRKLRLRAKFLRDNPGLARPVSLN
jgi:hypothetical protein